MSSSRGALSTQAKLALPLVALSALACEVEEPTHPQSDPFHLVPEAAASSQSRPYRIGPFRVQPDPPPISTPGPLVSEPEGAADTAPRGAEAPHVEAPLPPVAAAACPKEMALVHGNYCTDARQDCLHWIDPNIPPFPQKRCGKFAPSRCVGDRKHLRFCIDREELGEDKGALPVGDVSWTLAKEMCGARGKRLCNESEWTFACEGEDMRPYPTGFTRDATACNFDRTDLLDGRGKFLDHRAPSSAFPRCESPFGVLEMVGNVDEWVWRENAWTPWRAGLKGGWWLAGRNRCRPETTGHDEFYHDLQTGVRCCKDALDP